MPRIGDPAPQFSLPTDGGGRSNLSDYAGKKVVLYFYPKDDTPGCTKEACDFRDNMAAVKSAGAEILGVSPDSSSSHDEFKAKYQLPFPLLVDEDHAVAEAYGAWKEKMLYGRAFMGIERTTVLIDENQKIAGVWSRVQVDGHAQHVIAVLKGEQPAPVPVDTAPSKPVAQKAETKVLAAKVVAKSAAMAAAKAAPAKAAAAKPAAKAAAKPAAKPAVKPAAKAKKAAPKAKTVAPKAKTVAPKPVKKAAKPAAKNAASKAPKKPAGKAHAKKAPKKKK